MADYNLTYGQFFRAMQKSKEKCGKPIIKNTYCHVGLSDLAHRLLFDEGIMIERGESKTGFLRKSVERNIKKRIKEELEDGFPGEKPKEYERMKISKSDIFITGGVPRHKFAPLSSIGTSEWLETGRAIQFTKTHLDEPLSFSEKDLRTKINSTKKYICRPWLRGIGKKAPKDIRIMALGNFGQCIKGIVAIKTNIAKFRTGPELIFA